MGLRLPIKAGPQTIGVAFVKKTPPGADDLWAIYAHNSGEQNVAITGPINPSGPGESPSPQHLRLPTGLRYRRTACARTILSAFARRALRAPTPTQDVDTMFAFYQTARAQGFR